ncbi:MAG: hypothetical protein A2076_13060 [Geobacteraceae bacterium GWC2_53_11]|nr:MAG: hypothetical protein A2076_13060 [Geobacteraceae bacterium GWC2_53_11]
MGSDEKTDDVRDIEKAKLEALNEINKRFDEKLQHSLRIFRFAVWSVSFCAAILIGTLGVLGYKGYKDIQKTVQSITKENAEKVMTSPEFKKKINEQLNVVVETKISEMDNLSGKIEALKTKISNSDTRNVIHNLFSEIEPRLNRLEKLEKNNQVQVSADGINFFENDKKILTMQVGLKALTKEEIKSYPTKLNVGSTKKIIFSRPFKETPQVFLQLDQSASPDSIKPKVAVTSVQPDKDGFTMIFSPLFASNMAFMGLDNVKVSWIAIGR